MQKAQTQALFGAILQTSHPTTARCAARQRQGCFGAVCLLVVAGPALHAAEPCDLAEAAHALAALGAGGELVDELAVALLLLHPAQYNSLRSDREAVRAAEPCGRVDLPIAGAALVAGGVLVDELAAHLRLLDLWLEWRTMHHKTGGSAHAHVCAAGAVA